MLAVLEVDGVATTFVGLACLEAISPGLGGWVLAIFASNNCASGLDPTPDAVEWRGLLDPPSSSADGLRVGHALLQAPLLPVISAWVEGETSTVIVAQALVGHHHCCRRLGQVPGSRICRR